MRIRLNRTAAASALAIVAVALPCAAWYVAGTRETAREAARFRAEPERAARDTAARLAQQLGAQLNALRESEAQRPFYHYQNLIHEPRGVSEGVALIPSPLAGGPADPLVRSYFQIDAAGRLTLPTVNEDVAELNTAGALAGQLAIKSELQAAVTQLAANIRQEAVAPQQKAPQAVIAQVAQAAQQEQPAQAQALSPDAYAQNRQAGKLYADVKGRKGRGAVPETYASRSVATPKGDVVVRVGPLRWRTVALAGAPALAGLREVITPDEPLVQGFVISAEGAARRLAELRTAAFPVRLEPGAPSGPTEAAMPLAGADWKIVCDPSAASSAALANAREVELVFRRRFLAGVGAAGLAAVALVFIVAQTERLARQRSRFAASAAHELRTPLAGLRMYAEMLAEGLGDPARSQDYARRLADESERLGRVVANVLGFTRLERGTLSVRLDPGDLAAAVAEAVTRMRPAVEAAGARVELDAAANLPPVKFDHDAVAQIVQNLLDNAEKHTRAAADRTIRISLAAAGGAVVLSVADHGPGIPAAMRRRLFRPFERGNTPDAPAGLGLGLALVHALTRAQGGRVTCEDAPGGGTVFSLTFPTTKQ